ncbi:MAG: hypothetical protein HZB55_02445, partial [Deltaproteobacteria bacterium]|nr:hypothetical protein [Deltaproteobacteria bacterium]
LNLPKGYVISMPSLEYDGTLLSGFDSDGYPIVDEQALGFYRAEIIGYDLGARGTDQTVGTWIALQKTPTSGVVINGASTNWCSFSGIGGEDGEIVKRVIQNMIDTLLAGTYTF